MNDYYIKQNNAVLINDLVYLQALENYTCFHFKDGSSLISSYTLKKHESALPGFTFLRVNRSTIINSNYVRKVVNKNRTNFIRMKNGLEIRVSRRRQESLENLPI
jgi:two-component system LytT family response regulator